jgi:hypothetical protein
MIQNLGRLMWVTVSVTLTPGLAGVAQQAFVLQVFELQAFAQQVFGRGAEGALSSTPRAICWWRSCCIPSQILLSTSTAAPAVR